MVVMLTPLVQADYARYDRLAAIRCRGLNGNLEPKLRDAACCRKVSFRIFSELG